MSDQQIHKILMQYICKNNIKGQSVVIHLHKLLPDGYGIEVRGSKSNSF